MVELTNQPVVLNSVTNFSMNEKKGSDTPSTGSDVSADQHSWSTLTYETEIPIPDSRDNGAASFPNLKRFENPMLWSKTSKSFMLWMSCAATCLTTYAGGSYTAGLNQMSTYWGVSSVAIEAGVTAYTVGFAVAPMVLAPFSELKGRRPVIVISGILYVVFVICTGVTRLFAGMIIARFLVGAAASVFSTVIGGVIAEMYEADSRNTPMSIFSAGALLGLALGPLISGFVAQNLGWRWIFYIHAILAGSLVLVITVFYRETRETTILQKKAKKLNEWLELQERNVKSTEKTIRWKIRDEDASKSYWSLVGTSTTFPFKLLFTEPIIFWFSLWISFAWSILYCAFSIIPYTFQKVYLFNLQDSEAIFASVSIAVILSAAWNIYREKMVVKFLPKRFSTHEESRIYASCVEGWALPIGLFWFGWTIRSSIHWIVPTLAMGFATIGIFSIYLAVTNYLADNYKVYASSAIAAQSFSRNLMGGVFPLFSEQMYNRLGFGPASSLLGAIGAALAFIPLVLVAFGPSIRARSKFAVGLSK